MMVASLLGVMLGLMFMSVGMTTGSSAAAGLGIVMFVSGLMSILAFKEAHSGKE